MPARPDPEPPGSSGAAGLPGASGVPDLELLTEGSITVEGRLVDASNTTLLGLVAHCGREARCVYKPVAGERPLWDFPDGTLAAREAAAYAVSEATGWAVVPPTVLREGPFGPGMVQLWIDVDPDVELVDVVPRRRWPDGWLPVFEGLGADGGPVTLVHADDERLRRMAVLDTVLNNADRKGGHVLPAGDGHVFGVDHGVCFNVDEKLRTVLWGWAGQPLVAEETDVLERLLGELAGELGSTLRRLLATAEVRRTVERVERMLDACRFPQPLEGWPAIPWPPF
jgi:uncharacterized repeat protein (TIGR03843 family)